MVLKAIKTPLTHDFTNTVFDSMYEVAVEGVLQLLRANMIIKVETY